MNLLRQNWAGMRHQFGINKQLLRPQVRKIAPTNKSTLLAFLLETLKRALKSYLSDIEPRKLKAYLSDIEPRKLKAYLSDTEPRKLKPYLSGREPCHLETRAQGLLGLQSEGRRTAPGCFLRINER